MDNLKVCMPRFTNLYTFTKYKKGLEDGYMRNGYECIEKLNESYPEFVHSKKNIRYHKAHDEIQLGEDTEWKPFMYRDKKKFDGDCIIYNLKDTIIIYKNGVFLEHLSEDEFNKKYTYRIEEDNESQDMLIKFWKEAKKNSDK